MSTHIEVAGTVTLSHSPPLGTCDTDKVVSGTLTNRTLIILTNRFHVAVHLFNNRSQMTSKCGKNKKVAHEAHLSVSLMFLPHFDVLCDLFGSLSKH